MSTTCTVVMRLFSREYMNFKACTRYTWTVHMDGILEGEERSDHSVELRCVLSQVSGFRFQVSGLMRPETGLRSQVSGLRSQIFRSQCEYVHFSV